MGNNDNKETPAVHPSKITEEYLERNKQRERTRKKTPEQIDHEQTKQFILSVVVFNFATVLSVFFLFVIEFYFVEPLPRYGFFELIARILVAFKRALESPDIIFLVFSLALTVIIESITSRGKAAPKSILTAEGFIGLVALVIYIFEEIHMRELGLIKGELPGYLKNNPLIESRWLIHAVFLIGVIFFATLGYYMRAKKKGIGEIWRNICMRSHTREDSAQEKEVQRDG